MIKIIIFLLLCNCSPCMIKSFEVSTDAPIYNGIQGSVEMKKNSTGADSCWLIKIKKNKGKIGCIYCD